MKLKGIAQNVEVIILLIGSMKVPWECGEMILFAEDVVLGGVWIEEDGISNTKTNRRKESKR